MSDPVEQAVDYFRQGFSCAQAVCAAFAPGLGLDAESALRVAGAFGGGIARQGALCGAAGGALMALGLRYAPTQPDSAAKDYAYAQGREFLRRFRERFGALNCRELLACDVSDPQELERARQEGLFQSMCPQFVRGAAEIVAEML
jgi:C_GCAxxG_C_C family probable redox protein